MKKIICDDFTRKIDVIEEIKEIKEILGRKKSLKEKLVDIAIRTVIVK